MGSKFYKFVNALLPVWWQQDGKWVRTFIDGKRGEGGWQSILYRCWPQQALPASSPLHSLFFLFSFCPLCLSLPSPSFYLPISHRLSFSLCLKGTLERRHSNVDINGDNGGHLLQLSMKNPSLKATTPWWGPGPLNLRVVCNLRISGGWPREFGGSRPKVV